MVGLLAQAAGFGLVQWLIIAIVVCAAIGIAMVAIKASGIPIPPAVWTIVWILLIAVLAIFAIKLIVGMA